MSNSAYQGPHDSKRFRTSDWYSVSVDSLRFWMGLLSLVAIGVVLFYGYGSWRAYWVEQRAFEWVSRSEGLITQLDGVSSGSVSGFRPTVQRGRALVADAKQAIAEERFAEAVDSGEAAHGLLQDLLERARSGSSIAWFRSVQGDVRFRRGESGDFVRAFARTELQEGDYVMAGEGGTAEIHYRGEDTIFTLRPNTLVKLSRGQAGRIRTLGEMEYGWVSLDTAEESSGVNTPTTRVLAREHTRASLEMDRGSGDTVVRVSEGEATATALATGESRDLQERQQVEQRGDRFGETVSLLPAPELLAPNDGMSVNIDTTDRVEVRWRAVQGAASYTLQVTRGRLFAENLVDQRRPGTSATLALAEEGHYRWRVAAVDGRGRVGAWSEPRRLRVESYQSLAIEPDEDPPQIELDVSMSGSFAVLKGRTEPGARLTVNGELIPTFADGTFSTTFGVAGTGRIELVFEATDPSGNSTIERREVWIDQF